MISFIKKIALFFLVGIPIGILFILPCIFILPYQTGGFGGNGIPFGPYDTLFHPVDYYYVKNIDNFDSLRQAEIITIGDSFSQGGVMGYQNYLGHSINHKVSNFRIKNARPENTAYTLLQKRMIPECKVLIIESVERAFVQSLSNEFIIFDEITQKTIITKHQTNLKNFFNEEDTEIKQYLFDFKLLASYYKNKVSLSKNYIELSLSDSMFTSHKYSKALFCLYDKNHWDGDICFTSYKTENYLRAKDNLNILINLAKEQGITLIYLIPADKYDLYYDYIVDNPYPRNPSFDYFSSYDTTVFVNTKALLLPYIQNGVKDVYRVNDTHWSIVAAKIVGEHLGKIIKDKQALNQ